MPSGVYPRKPHTIETKLKISKSHMGIPAWNKGKKRELSHSWKGGFYINNGGYKLILLPKHHRADSKGYVYEHIVVIEKKLGRLTKIGEVIHHINGNKLDNSPNNLTIFLSRNHHAKHHAITSENWGKKLESLA